MGVHLQLIANRESIMLKVHDVCVARNERQIFKCFVMSKVQLQTLNVTSYYNFCFRINQFFFVTTRNTQFQTFIIYRH
jgi:hypothetical protein